MKSALLIFITAVGLLVNTNTANAETPEVMFYEAESEVLDGGYTPMGKYIVKLMKDTADCADGIDEAESEVLDGGYTLMGKYIVILMKYKPCGLY